MYIVLSSLFLAMTAASGTPLDAATDLAANASSGRWLCMNPIVEAKSCSSISRYEIRTDGTVLEHTEIALPASQPLSFELAAPVEIKGNVVCAALSAETLDNGVVRLDGKPLGEDQNRAAMASIKAKLNAMIGIRSCDLLRVENGQLLKFAQIDKVDLNLPPKPVSWITESDGYRVGR